MYIYVYMYICIYIFIYTPIFDILIYTYIYIYIYVYIAIFIYLYKHIQHIYLQQLLPMLQRFMYGKIKAPHLPQLLGPSDMGLFEDFTEESVDDHDKRFLGGGILTFTSGMSMFIARFCLSIYSLDFCV